VNPEVRRVISRTDGSAVSAMYLHDERGQAFAWTILLPPQTCNDVHGQLLFDFMSDA